jgi:hypothetical protein
VSVCKHFRKKWEYLKDKINELATHSKNNHIRDLFSGINEFTEGYQHTINLAENESGHYCTTLQERQ